jgi:hypothetical protein
MVPPVTTAFVILAGAALLLAYAAYWVVQIVRAWPAIGRIVRRP